MRVGTKSLLFGVHQVFLHWIFVWIAWRRLYGRRPNLKETLCIFWHDWGYAGAEWMDLGSGVLHPLLGGRLSDLLFGPSFGDLVRFHSRKVAVMYGAQPSALCAPDKLASLLYPKWLYLLLARASGEIDEYKSHMGMTHLSDGEWFDAMCGVAYDWAEEHVCPAHRDNMRRTFPRHTQRNEPGVAGHAVPLA